jgi:hypothetical protein
MKTIKYLVLEHIQIHIIINKIYEKKETIRKTRNDWGTII